MSAALAISAAPDADTLMLRRYTFKLYPNAGQLAALDRQRVMCAQLWNALLEQRETQWRHECQRKPKGERKGLSYFDQTAEITKLRAACPEWRDMAAGSMRQVAQLLDKAFKAFFQRAKKGAGAQSGYPRFKSAKFADCIPHKESLQGWKMTRRDGRNWIVAAKGIPGVIKARGQFPADPESIRNMDLMLRDGAWWMSVCVKIAPRRAAGHQDITVRFDLIDEFARVERAEDGGRPSGSQEQIGRAYEVRHEGSREAAENASVAGDLEDGGLASQARAGDERRCPSRRAGDEDHALALRLAQIAALDQRKDVLQAARDIRFKRGSWRHRDASARIAKLSARAARIRREALHVWTTAVARGASNLTVHVPRVKEVTASPRGDEKSWGAAVETVSRLNRNTLSQAPALAVLLLSYKAAEAAVPFLRVEEEAPVVAVGADLVSTAKAVRRARRALKKGNPTP